MIRCEVEEEEGQRLSAEMEAAVTEWCWCWCCENREVGFRNDHK